MTPYSPDNSVDTQLAFLSHIIIVALGVVGVCLFSIGILLISSKNVSSIVPEIVMSSIITPIEPLVDTLPQDLSGEELKVMLRNNNLWDIDAHAKITPLVISSFPENLDLLSIDDKKKIFLHSLLPIVLTANSKIDQERLRLFDILASSGALPGNFLLQEIPEGWKAILSIEDKLWLKSLSERYNAKDIKELKKRMRRIPVSLVMAQGALESSWGTSRFAQEGNNLFGLRTWGKKGLEPENHRPKSTYLLASYDSILESVHAYLLTLNSHRLYTNFRKIRLSSQDPIVLSKGLIYYSEKRKEYVSQVNRIIKYNSLKKFDTVQLRQLSPSKPLVLLSKK